MFGVEALTVLASLFYCVHKVWCGSWRFEPGMEAQIMRLLLLVVVLFFLTGDPGVIFARTALGSITSPSGYFTVAVRLSAVIITLSPSLWVACIWVPTLFLPPKHTSSGLAQQLDASSCVESMWGDLGIELSCSELQLSSSERSLSSTSPRPHHEKKYSWM
jgi:hypothetical protein